MPNRWAFCQIARGDHANSPARSAIMECRYCRPCDRGARWRPRPWRCRMLRLLVAGPALALALGSTPLLAADEPDFTRARLNMVFTIQLEAAMMSETTGVPSIDE